MSWKLDRREFFKIAGLAGLGAVLPPFSKSAFAETGHYGGPYFIAIHAGGAWDPAFLCDPKNNAELNRITLAEGTSGRIKYAALPVDASALGLEAQYADAYNQHLMTNEAFFAAHGSRLTILNGVDTSTNNHETGTRVVWSGRIAEDYPSLSALVAATRGPTNTMSFISAGGYDATNGLVPLTRVSNPGSLARVADPNVHDPNRADSETYHAHSTFDRIKAAQAERLAAQQAAAGLPATRRAMGELILARATSADLERLVLPESLVTIPGYQLGDLQSLMQQTQLAMSAFEAGLAVSANLVLGGFDTHANHDRDQRRQLAKLLHGIDYVVKEATRRNILDKVVIVVGSDFGRGPRYNGPGDYSGKDHWPITSMMLLGAGIEGNRVIGATDADQKPLGVDPTTLATSATGTKLTPAVIQKALRRKLGIDAGDPAKKYGLSGADLALFG
ncbi:MAG: DUF1501 domain-containing protein [Bradymonadaceae bacterium]|nr:DUF1501 domain-containing protein [Lujinxingiaceae bacterium]